MKKGKLSLALIAALLITSCAGTGNQQAKETLREAGRVSKEKGEYYALQQDALETAVKSTTSLMEHGSTTYLEILTAQTSLLNAQISVIANKLDEINGVISLYQALGGGKE